MKTTKIFSGLIIITAVFFISCKTEINPPEDPNNTTNRYETVNVLNDNSSYENVWDTVMEVRVLSSGAKGSLGISDLTVDMKQRMNFVFYQVLPSQQSTLYQSYRRTWDLSGKKMIPQNPNAAKETVFTRYILNYQADHNLAFESYKPYTNYFAEGYLTNEGGGGISYNRAIFQGDISFYPALAFYPLGALELGYENAVGKSSFYTAVIFWNLNKKDNEEFNYKSTNAHVDYAIFQYVKPNIQTYQLFCEARTSGPSVYFGFTQENKLQAIEFTDTGNFQKETLTGTKATNIVEIPWYNPYVSWVKQPYLYPKYEYKTIRHYNSDGSIMSFALKNITTNKYSTFVYNFNTKEFKTVLDDVSLEYGDSAASDVDIDEEGNLYYTGYARSGTKKDGISVYKISSGNTTSLVGTDNFLKSGQVIKLKLLHGKIYMCITGEKTGYDIHQLSFIRQK